MEYRIINCKNCGEEMPLKLSVCPHCGKKNTVKACHVCGSSMSIHAHTCSTCGARNKKSLPKQWWIGIVGVVIIVVVIFSVVGITKKVKDNEATKKANNTTVVTTVSSTTTQTTEDPYKNVEKKYIISAGNYIAGKDIPVGKCDIKAISGTGNLTTPQETKGGINEIFGVDDGTGLYTEGFSGLELSNDEMFTVSGNLRVELTYSEIKSNVTERVYDEKTSFTLTNGTYTAGQVFPAGVYKLVIVSGYGNMSTSNSAFGGVNETYNEDSTNALNNMTFLNADFPEGTVLSVTKTLTVKLIPLKS